jgi:hypothetical protein
MPTMEDIKSWRADDARGSDGNKLAKTEDIYLDRETGKPEWMAVMSDNGSRSAGPVGGSGTRGYGL